MFCGQQRVCAGRWWKNGVANEFEMFAFELKASFKGAGVDLACGGEGGSIAGSRHTAATFHFTPFILTSLLALTFPVPLSAQLFTNTG